MASANFLWMVLMKAIWLQGCFDLPASEANTKAWAEVKPLTPATMEENGDRQLSKQIDAQLQPGNDTPKTSPAHGAISLAAIRHKHALIVPSVSHPIVGLLEATCPAVSETGRMVECLCVLLERSALGQSAPQWYNRSGQPTGFSSPDCGLARLLVHASDGEVVVHTCQAPLFVQASEDRVIAYRVSGTPGCLKRRLQHFLRLIYSSVFLTIFCLVLFTVVIVFITQQVGRKCYLSNNDIRALIQVRQEQMSKLWSDQARILSHTTTKAGTVASSFELPSVRESDQF